MTFALEGVRMVDFGFFLAGPFSGRLLADLGADVIKVEEIGGDPARRISSGSSFECVNKGKRGLALDLKTPEGRAIAQRLAARADIVHHNMRVGVAERLGIGYEQLRPLNPRLIYCHSSGYGSVGPRARRPTFEPMHSALAGLLTLTAGEGNEPMTYLTHMDFGVGLNAACAMLMALIERTRSGRGQFLEVPQTATAILCSSDVFFRNGSPSQYLRLDAAQTGHGALSRLYPTADGWLCLACHTEEEWARLCAALELPDLPADPRFTTFAGRYRHREALSALLEARFAQRTAVEWFEIFHRRGVPCELPAGFRGLEFLRNPVHLASGLTVEHNHASFGNITEIGQVVRFSETPGVNRRPSPLLGEHTREILRELDYTDAEIDAFVRERIVACSPAAS